MKTHSTIFLMTEIILLSLIPCVAGIQTVVSAQVSDEPPVSFEKKVNISISNPVRIERRNEPVHVPLSALKEKAPDFNKNFFRVKYPVGNFEPLDIPSQLRAIAGGDGAEEIVFLVDLGSGESTAVELWYNSSGIGLPDYPIKTQSFDRWYTGGTNLAWENDVIAYRAYSGVVDYFAKSYPHLRLHDLPPDSYHHERLWGVDPYVIGAKPGLGGILLFDGPVSEKLYGGGKGSQLSFSHRASGAGPVCTEAVVDMIVGGEKRLEAHYVLYAGRHDNDVTILLDQNPGQSGRDILIAPGMQKFDKEWFIMDKKVGYCLSYVSPMSEYGTIATAFVWNPGDASDVTETKDGAFIKLKPDTGGRVQYRSVAVWYRASADQPTSSKAFEEYVKDLALCFRNPVKVSVQ